MNLPKNIFTIYTSQDKDVLQYFLLHLQSVKNNFNIAIWSDDSVDDIDLWKSANVSRLDETHVFPILLSNTFMNSEFVKSDEFRMVIERYKADKAVIVPIILDDCSWDVNFTFDHCNFNFNELQVFHKNENPISNGSPTDIVFTQVSYYIMGLLNSFTKKSAIEKPISTEEQKESSLATEGQIAFDFFEESVTESKDENGIKNRKEAEAKKQVEEENKLLEETEVQEQIIKERWLKQKAENQRIIEKEAEARRAVVQEEIREREFIKARIAIGQKRQEQVTESLREPAWEQGFGETVTTQRITNRKNSLAKYNYRFNNKNTIEARSIVPERKRVIEEPKIQLVVEEKISEKIIYPVRETQREKELEETVAVEQTATRKTDLAKYNYLFDNKKEVEVLEVEIEKSDKEEIKSQVAVEKEKRRTMLKVLEETEWKKKLGERVASLQAVAKESISKCKHLLDRKIEAWDKKVVPDESSGKEKLKGKQRPTVLKSLGETQWKKKFGERVTSLKTSAKESLSKYRQLLNKKLEAKSKRVVSEEKLDSKKSKSQLAVEKKKWTELPKTLSEVKWDLKLHKRTAALKEVVKKYFNIVQGSLIKNIAAINKLYKEAKKNISADKKTRVRSGILITALAIFGVVTYVFIGDTEKQSFTPSEIEKVEVVSDDVSVNTENAHEISAGAKLELNVGDMYNGGIIFTIDPSNETGKIAYMEDKGPMNWKNAMHIHEQLGEGWRLPELDELRSLYKTIGQGADNKGKFVKELYWSATPFDQHQARLVKFSDGNASYHYNSSGTHRKFRVRAIKDFKR
ncbi:DUF1566 domain-containing protein [Zobellia nedashkovskayae]|uniref:Lcl domain-containing protein n=1 Tax=Zobellia nedashkovskayae TaxID=2779510 RepID=UPI00188C5362|nr:DUF1566 domain-containing protein [Zobellia nedashkovskayae]